MPAHSYFVITGFTLLLMIMVTLIIRLHETGSGFLGRPSIDKLYFYSGKLAVFTTWTLFLLKAINPTLGYIYIPAGLSWFAVAILYVGLLILSIALINLGKSLQVGLPDRDTTLKTHGLFRFSRNPLYLGVYIISIGSCIYFPDLINVSFTIYGIYLHHKIIKAEEQFLSERFGTDWLNYSARVGRYI